MIKALFYLQFHSVKNRLLGRIKRLRQPKYLFGAIVGGAYFYFYIFRFMAGGRRGLAVPPPVVSPENQVLIESLVALGLLVLFLLGWILPKDRAALAFSEAEVAFLFPAPLSRRALINFKLLKSQTAILFSALLIALLARRGWSGGSFWIRAAGWWVILGTMNLHGIGSSFARTMMLERGISNGQRRLVVLTAAAVLIGGVIYWAWQTIPAPTEGDFSDFKNIVYYLKHTLASGPLPYLLIPFQMVVRPFLSATAAEFFRALGPALLVMALHYWWVIRSNVAFEEGSIEYSRKLADRMTALRSNNWQVATKPKKSKRPPFALAPNGPAAIAIFWKNLISAGQMFTARLWIFLLWIVVFGGSFLTTTARHSGTVSAVGFFGVMLLGMSLFLGPQLLRNDLRQDLLVTDILKMYPMRGWQIILGELLAPSAILTGVQWLLLIVIFLSGFPSAENFSFASRLIFTFVAALICPIVNLVLLLIPNAAVLILPAWFHAKEPPQGIEVTGQRLILMLGQIIILLLALLPAGLIGALVYFAVSSLLSPMLAVAATAIAAGAILAVEAAFAIKQLGKLFERFDLSAELGA